MRRWAAIVALTILAAAGWTLFQASLAERSARQAVRDSGEIPFHIQAVSAAPPARWEMVASPADFRDALVWRGALYVAGANTLFRYSEDGRLDRAWRAGFELPAAPLECLAAADELWIGTLGEGLVSFDGSVMRRILPGPVGARKIRALHPLATGGLLIGADTEGVLRFDGDRLRAAHPALQAVAVTALAGTEDDLWVGTRDNGVIHLRAGHAERFSESDGLPDNAVHALAAAGERAFAATSTGIAEFRGGRLARVLGQGILALSMTVRDQELIAGTLGDGWLRIPLLGRPARADAERGDVRKVVAAGDDLYLVRPGSVEIVRGGQRRNAIDGEASLLTHANISALAMDSAQRLWVGYFDRGLDIVAANREGIAHIENERVFCVNRIVDSTDGQRMAVATANGLVLFEANGRERQVLTRADGLIASHVTDVVARGEGWIAATPAGITFLAGPPRSIYGFHGLVNNHVYSLAANGEGLLAGTLGGVSKLRGETIAASYTTANSALKTNWVTALAEVDTEWFAGTYGGGVQRLTAAGAWQTFDTMPANAVVNPNAMAVSPRAVYAGTLEHGLLIWDRARQAWRSVRAGLPSANVTAILYHGNRLYLGTDNGLVTAPESAMGL